MRKTIRHLLPKSPSWSLEIDRPFARFVHGIADFLDDSRQKLDDVLMEGFPWFTSDPITQLDNFGIPREYTSTLTTESARDLLVLVRETPTDMSPGRLQRFLQTLWPGVYVHEWWASEGPYVARDPSLYIVQPQSGRTRCGQTSARCGVPSARCNNFLINEPNYLVNQSLVAVPPPTYTTGAEYVLYIGGEVFGTDADIPESDRPLIEFLILRYKRATNWVVFFFNNIATLTTEGGAILTTEDGSVLTVE